MNEVVALGKLDCHTSALCEDMQKRGQSCGICIIISKELVHLNIKTTNASAKVLPLPLHKNCSISVAD